MVSIADQLVKRNVCYIFSFVKAEEYSFLILLVEGMRKMDKFIKKKLFTFAYRSPAPTC